jgi:uncharacterized SAM-binding protein YcdF (DUF218 family)
MFIKKLEKREKENIAFDLFFFIILLLFTFIFVRQFILLPSEFPPSITIDVGMSRWLLGGITLLGGAMSFIFGWSVYRKIKS